ncbi:hypothetical protein BpHYR1_024908 [Brachionus plicatilis]|uniref:Uncharacterized protein n=1 Tax=Brachionus plicatilis TaxID=10195 RepID=A0A3M7QJF9_BRAPC|nr:hypothetical protein BpHYR1_024908 [Brachionus plicatilis]
MIRTVFYHVFLIVLPILICSSSIIDNNSKTRSFDGHVGKLSNPVKRHLLKRIQIPFKWGKRSLFANTNSKEFCSDFFAVLITQNRRELKRLRELDISQVYHECFNYMLGLNSLEVDSENDQFSEHSLNDEISIEGDTRAELLKRSNIPFRWG